MDIYVTAERGRLELSEEYFKVSGIETRVFHDNPTKGIDTFKFTGNLNPAELYQVLTSNGYSIIHETIILN